MLERLLKTLTALIARATTRLQEGTIPLSQWERVMQRALARYSNAAFMAGKDSPTMTDAELKAVGKMVNAQLKYLEGFVVDMQNEKEFKEGWQARAGSYANAVVQPYWGGKTKLLPLPDLPGNPTGTQCGGRCRCKWDIKKLAGDGNYDCTWVIDKKAESCQTCEVRAERWNPLKIRGDKVVIEDE